MSGFSAIALDRLPPPDVVEALDFETILAAMLDDLRARWPAFDATVEAEPARMLLEVAAYRELTLRQRVNDAARAVMLASATGADLDHLAALLGVARAVLDPGDAQAAPPRPAVMEDDARLRLRAQLSMEGRSVAGPRGSYVFHALGADARVRDVSVESPAPGEVVITVLSAEGDGAPGQDLLDAVAATLSAEDVRPLTDHVTVQGATVTPWRIEAVIHPYRGPSGGVVLAQAQAQAEALAARLWRLDHDVATSAVMAALHVEGVRRVTLTDPPADIAIGPEAAARCSEIVLSLGAADV